MIAKRQSEKQLFLITKLLRLEQLRLEEEKKKQEQLQRERQEQYQKQVICHVRRVTTLFSKEVKSMTHKHFAH